MKTVLWLLAAAVVVAGIFTGCSFFALWDQFILRIPHAIGLLFRPGQKKYRLFRLNPSQKEHFGVK